MAWARCVGFVAWAWLVVGWRGFDHPKLWIGRWTATRTEDKGDEAGCDRQGRGGCVCPSYLLRKRRSGGFPAFHGGAALENQGRFFLQPWIY